MLECCICDIIRMTDGICLNAVYMILLKWEEAYVWMLYIRYY
jgi:hypothetical protein